MPRRGQSSADVVPSRLNEGWTVYLERRLQAAAHGAAYRDFSAIIGWAALEQAVRGFGEEHEFTKLVVDLKGKNPDDAFSTVPYEKGYAFLSALEQLLGADKWDAFIPHVRLAVPPPPPLRTTRNKGH